MDRRAFIGTLAGLVFATGSGVFAQTSAPPQPPQPRWGQQAEKEFGLGRGLGPSLMTEEEWKEHQDKMRSMSPTEREKYRQETHQKMLERAKEKGMAVPAEPGAPRDRKSVV